MVPTDGGVTGVSRSPLVEPWRPADWEVRQRLTFAHGVENVSRLGSDSTLPSSLVLFSFFFFLSFLFRPSSHNLFHALAIENRGQK